MTMKKLIALLTLLCLGLTGLALAEEPPLGPGWNLGNTFDAYLDGQNIDPMDLETLWVGARTTEDDVAAVADAGFEVFRLPVSWHDHVSGDDFAIDPAWMDRVQEVADWALARGMTLILNSHHDIDQRFFYPDSEHYDQSERYLTAIWAQICERFGGYDDKVIFEFMNEPRLKDTAMEWAFAEHTPACVDAADCIGRLTQRCVDVVRASGGNNATRWLMVTPYAASPYSVQTDHFRLPDDPAGRLIVSVHTYTPYAFTLKPNGVRRFDPTKPYQVNEINKVLDIVCDKYVSRGIPVYIGEFGCVDRDNLEDRVAYMQYFCATARARGIYMCVWDNNMYKQGNEWFGLLNRATAEWYFPEVVQAMIEASK